MNPKDVFSIFARLGVFAGLLMGIAFLFGGEARAQGITYTWTNVGGGNFEVATNWTPTGVPGPNDTAVFNSNFTYTVNGSRTVNSIVIAGSTVAFTGTITTSNLSVTTSGGGLIVFSGNFNLNGPGTVAAGSVLTLTGGNLSGTGTLTVDGTMNWATTNIFLNTTISAGATANATGSGDRGLGGMLTNRGTFNYAGGRMTNAAGSNGQFRNENLVDVQTDTSFQFIGNAPTTFLNTATGTLRKTGGTGNLDFNGFPLTNAGTIDVRSGRIRLFNDLMNTGTIMVTGGTQVFEFGNSNSTLAAGTVLAGTGRFQLTGANVTVMTGVSASNLDLVGGNLSGTGSVTATNSVFWTSTLINTPFVVETGATMTTVGSGDHGVAGILTNRGTFNYTSGRITNGAGSNGQFRNENLVDVQFDTSFQFVGNTPSPFLNTATGVLRKSGGTGNLDFNGFPLTNAGTIDVQSGRIRIFNDLMNSGTIMVTGGAQVFEFGNSNATLSAGTMLTGTGRFQLSNTNVTVATGVSVPNLDLVGGNLSGTGSVTATSSVFWTSTLINTSFVVETGATMTTVGAGDHGLAGMLTNRGIFNYTSGRITNGGGNGGQFRNENLVDVQTDAAFQFVGNTPTTFLNTATGLLRKSGGTGNLDFNTFPLTNAGTIDVQSGRIRLFSDLMNTGTLMVTGGTQVFEFGNSNTTLSAGTTLTGAGRFQLSNANVNVPANLNVPNLDLIGGNLNGTGTLTLTGSGNWTSSQINGVLVVAPGVTLNLVGAVDRGLSGSLTNQGTVNLAGGRLTNGGNAGFFRNESIFDATADVSVVFIGGGTPSFINAPTGLIRKTGGTGPLTLTWPLTNQGTIDCPRDFRVDNFTQSATGTLNVDIGGTTQAVQYDRLQTSNVSLNGTLNLSLSNGFQPSLGQTFDIVTSNTRTGTFSAVNGRNQGQVAFDPVYLANSVRLNVIDSPCPTISLDPATLPNPVIGVAFNQTVTATGGNAPYTFTVTSGELPNGLTLSSAGVISGTPTATGTFNFQITATDADGCGGSASYTLVVSCPTITLSPMNLPNGTVGAMYGQTITASGGLGNYSFMPVAGMLPPGLALSSVGMLAGNPTARGTYQFTIRATDTVTNCFGERGYTVVIGCPTISLSGLTDGTVGSMYSQTILASGGAAPYSFTLTSGALPTGLSLAGNGAVTGAPTAAGTFNVVITATDANGCAGAGSFAVSITQNCPTIVIAPPTLPDATVGLAYSQMLTATGGTAPYQFAIEVGTTRFANSPPSGLTLSSDGLLSGAPTQAGTADFTVVVTDANGCAGFMTYSLVVNPEGDCAFTVSPTSPAFPSSGGTGRVTVTTGVSCSYTISGAPEWITGLAASGTGTQTLTFTVAVNPETTSRTATLTVAGQSVTVTQAGSVNLNSSIRLTGGTQMLAPSTCAANGYVNDFVIVTTLTNVGPATIYHGSFRLTDLRQSNGTPVTIPFRLISADRATCVSGGLPGARQTIDFGAGLAPGQSITVTFRVALSEVRRFILLMTFEGGSEAPLARASGLPTVPSFSSHTAVGAVDFAGRSAFETRTDGFALTLGNDFVLPRREVSKPAGF